MLFPRLIIYFAIYSFLGWIIEVAYRSCHQKEFVNAGFLRGCFVPLYGVAAITFLGLDNLINGWNVAVQFILYGIVATLMEYGAGLFSEHVLGVRLWNYADAPLNFQGRVSLPFSLVWATLGVLFIRIIHPFVSGLIIRLPANAAIPIATVFTVGFIIDFSVSISLARKLSEIVKKGYRKIIATDATELEKLLRKEKRFLYTFTSIRKDVAMAISAKFESNMGAILVRYKPLIAIREIRSEDLNDPEYLAIVADILTDMEFLRTKDYLHHKSSIFDHVLKVSYLAYQIAKFKGWDARAAARAGLLHDFFLYDWRDSNDPDRPSRNLHGFRHPKIALENSRKFNLSAIEEDIILKHMWPLTLRIPKYKESFLIMFLDKYVATQDFLQKEK
ncbi:MAG: hypothetical protein WCS54_04970 [Fibrobacteraceae bacterium]